MEIGRYVELKGKKSVEDNKELVQLVYLGPDFFQIHKKRFDEATGAEILPELGQISKQMVQEALQKAQQQLAALELSIASMNALLADMAVLQDQAAAEKAARDQLRGVSP